MLTFSAAAAFASLLPVAATVSPSFEKAVTVKCAIQPDGVRANHFNITVHFDIGDGWHTYDEAGEGPGEATTLRLELPDGVETVGDWVRPISMEDAEGHAMIYEGAVEFSQTVVVDPSAHGAMIDVEVAYQACTDAYCNPPQTKAFSIEVPETKSAMFEAPVRLMDKDGLLNVSGEKRFPSPVIFDVDGDGQVELVIGSLMGRMDLYENLNTEATGDPIWSSRKPFKNAKGRQIRTSNW